MYGCFVRLYFAWSSYHPHPRLNTVTHPNAMFPSCMRYDDNDEIDDVERWWCFGRHRVDADPG
jgi:hypothetical protein